MGDRVEMKKSTAVSSGKARDSECLWGPEKKFCRVENEGEMKDEK